MLNLKKLQAVDGQTPFEANSSALPTGNLRLAFQTLGALALVLSLVLLAWVLTTRPQPIDVTQKQVDLTYGGMKVYQDSTPLQGYEHSILRFHESDVDYMSPMELIIYFRMLKNGPMLSYNFQENYQMLKDAYHIRLGAAITGVGVGLLFLILSLLMPKRPKDVGVRKGSEWG